MKINLKNLLLLFCLGLIVFVTTPLLANSWLSQNPLRKNCLPSGVISYEILAEYQSYLLVQYPNIDNADSPNNLLVKLGAGDTCDWIMGTNELFKYSMKRYIPEEIAKQLALRKFRYLINTMGQEQVQFIYGDAGDIDGDNILYIFPENYWALQKLGIGISSRYQLSEEYYLPGVADPTEYLP